MNQKNYPFAERRGNVSRQGRLFRTGTRRGAGGQVSRARTSAATLNFRTQMKNFTSIGRDLKGMVWMWLKMSGLRMETEVSLQVFDFSRVITIFHFFSPIFRPSFQPQWFDFSWVMQNTGLKRHLSVQFRRCFSQRTRRAQRSSLIGIKRQVLTKALFGLSRSFALPAMSCQAGTI
jgi:hypothetical protein